MWKKIVINLLTFHDQCLIIINPGAVVHATYCYCCLLSENYIQTLCPFVMQRITMLLSLLHIAFWAASFHHHLSFFLPLALVDDVWPSSSSWIAHQQHKRSNQHHHHLLWKWEKNIDLIAENKLVTNGFTMSFLPFTGIWHQIIFWFIHLHLHHHHLRINIIIVPRRHHFYHHFIIPHQPHHITGTTCSQKV